MTHVIKRLKDHVEPYDHHKLASSIKASCLTVRTPIGEAELTAQRVCMDILEWLEDRIEVTSADVRRKASECLQTYNPEAAYMYEQHDYLA